MACEVFKEWKPTGKSASLIDDCNQVIDALSAYRLTLRQLYYQLVTKNIIENSERAYQRLSQLVTRARLAGLLDWDAIEDRVRQPDPPPEYANLRELVEAALYSYRLPRWKGQDTYCELWVEKDALASVLRPLAKKYHVVLMVNRGYSSASAMKESAERFRARDDGERQLVLFYLGDLDPSGEDMVRDIRDRMELFGITLDVRKIALTYAQVKKYKPPPNPAKLTDPRAAAFVAKYGSSSWEVDALPPPVLNQIISSSIESVLDMARMQEVITRETMDKSNLRAAVKELQSEDEPEEPEEPEDEDEDEEPEDEDEEPEDEDEDEDEEPEDE